MVLLISSQGTLSVSTDPAAPLTPVQEMFRALQQANTTVFAFDPRGLTPGVKPDDLMSLTDATGGRTVAHTNDPESHVPEVFQQNGSYYLLGFQSINPRRDGRFRRIQVKVNRPDVIVRTRSGYFAPKDGQARRPSKTPLVQTLERGLPGTDLPMRVHVGTFAIPGRREAAVTLVTTVRDRAGTPGPRRLEILTAAFDTGWKERASHRQTIEFRAMPSGASGVEFDVLSRIALRPGRYELRLAAEMEGRTGSVLLNIDVPDFSKDPLTVSSVLLERSGSAHAGNDRLFADLIRVRPTAARVFRRTDTVSTFARVYWNATKVSAPVTVSSHITNEGDEAVFQRRVSLPTDASGSDRAEDCRIDLPLAQLGAGQYLLTLEAEAGPHRARRHVRFEVR
jgi:hypothetical protein